VAFLGNRRHAGYENIYCVLGIDSALGVSSNVVGITMPPLGPAMEETIPEVAKTVRVRSQGEGFITAGDRKYYTDKLAFTEAASPGRVTRSSCAAKRRCQASLRRGGFDRIDVTRHCRQRRMAFKFLSASYPLRYPPRNRALYGVDVVRQRRTMSGDVHLHRNEAIHSFSR
jgi:hypothetical protein